MTIFNLQRILFICFLPTLLALPGGTQELALTAGETAIEPGTTKRFEFGTVPQKDTIVTLEIESRLQSKTALGSSFFMKLALNGVEIKPARSRVALRLTNKPLTSPVTANLKALWFGEPRGWRVLYAPDFEVGRRQPYYEGDPHTLVLDVTDLINPAAENRLDVTNNADASAVQASGSSGNLVVGKLVVHSRAGQSPMTLPVSQEKAFVNRGEPGKGPAAYKGEVLPGGGFAMTVGGRRWEFESAFSYPNAGFNRLVAGGADRNGQAAWKVSAKADRGEVQATAQEYEVQRRVRFLAGQAQVEDTLTNRTAQPLGLVVRHETRLAGLPNPSVRIAGNPDPGVSDYYSPGNPSVVIQGADHMVGLLCEDDVFRNQARLYSTLDGGAAVAGVRTEMFYLRPHASYTLKWSVYAVGGTDYFDFINAVRKQWGANFTVDGAWYWGFYPDEILNMSDADLKTQFENQGIRYVSSGGGWVNYAKDKKRIGFGSGVLDPYWDDFRGRMRDAAAKMRRAVPGVKVLAYYDSQRDTSENADEKLRDGHLTNPDGNPHYTDWSNAYQRTFSGVATLDNAFGAAMLTTADRYMDEMKLDGIYWDEMENTAFGAPLITYNMPDGHSCQMDPKIYTVLREVGLTNLLAQAHRLEVIRRVKAKGGLLLGNGPTTTKAMLATGIQRMVESQHNDNFPAEGLLQTPLGYMSRQKAFADFVRMIRLGLLPVGTSREYAHQLSRYLFPFTPIELHSGYLLGEERIIASHSGNFGWSADKSLVRAVHFDSQGQITAKSFATEVGAEARTAVTLGEGEAIVLEKLPVRLEGGAARAQVLRADTTGLEVKLEAKQAVRLVVQGGVFPIKNGGRYRVVLGTQSKELMSSEGKVVVAIPAGFSGVVGVSEVQ